jgi:hypothetical protein
LFSQEIFSALLRAAESAGKSNPARIAIMAITTSSSIRVNGTLEKQYRREESDCITSEMRHFERKNVDFEIGLIIFSPVVLFFLIS